ncbi:MAG: NAD(P)-dependent oxidoreductase [Ignavibacteria bacterium]|jgi:putative NADH-flavin reductase|nr:NAD(P)-dependent oxidoreductase [Ignavibacteria bacterium]MCU7504290.1 NAD(P)-dependent oxidoreductase [Ignavibacteria bacterium]MCU7516135.1 NAD(P)-dependent oxidoreductase [Ignavibacteria bacterium]
MKVALIGASGFVGSAVLKEALMRGHNVTAILRHPEEIKIQDPKLTVKEGDVFNENEFAELLRGQDAVISTYNPGWTNPEIAELTRKGHQAIINGVKRAHVKRLITAGGAGSLEIAPGKQLVDQPEFPAEWKTGAMALRDALNTYRNEKDIDWTFFSPAINIFPGERTGKFRLGSEQPILDEKGQGRISVQDYAVAMIDELENPKHLKQRFTIGY